MGSSSLEAESLAGDLKHCRGFWSLLMRSGLILGGCRALMRSFTLLLATSVPVCLFVFQEAMLFSKECIKYYSKEAIEKIKEIFAMISDH